MAEMWKNQSCLTVPEPFYIVWRVFLDLAPLNLVNPYRSSGSPLLNRWRAPNHLTGPQLRSTYGAAP
jgi:hypothetical protein